MTLIRNPATPSNEPSNWQGVKTGLCTYGQVGKMLSMHSLMKPETDVVNSSMPSNESRDIIQSCGLNCHHQGFGILLCYCASAQCHEFNSAWLAGFMTTEVIPFAGHFPFSPDNMVMIVVDNWGFLFT